MEDLGGWSTEEVLDAAWDQLNACEFKVSKTRVEDFDAYDLANLAGEIKRVFEGGRPSEDAIQRLLFLAANSVALRLRDLDRHKPAASGFGAMRTYAQQAGSPACVCCVAATATSGPRICPVCRHEFQGNGWDGIDAHWRAHHESFMRYETFWRGLCDAHRRGHPTGG